MRPSILLLASLGLAVAESKFQYWVAAESSSQRFIQNAGDVHTTAEWSFNDCGLPSDIVQLESLEISPDPPVPGEELTINAKGKATRRIEEGATADVVVKLGLIKLLQKTFDICEEATKANASVTCPVEEGDYEVTQTVKLPKEIPPAKFTVSVRAFSVDDEDMLCLNLFANFMPKKLQG
ncbi:ML domain-containing protein [Mycena amicta]|nr:ML domain-containing protein [Mycena amicta]